jgi:hypothetical protein
VTSRIHFPDEGWWSEDGDQCWLPLWYGCHDREISIMPVDETRVRRLFFTGHKIPTCPARDGVPYECIEAKISWIRLGEEDEHGWAGSGDDMCYRTTADDPRSFPCWEISLG